MATTDVLWAAWEGRGFEHLALCAEPAAVCADSLIIAVDDDGRPYRARYVVDCDAGWKVARAGRGVEQPARLLDVRADGRGHWIDAATGAALALDGCVDIDIYPVALHQYPADPAADRGGRPACRDRCRRGWCCPS